MSENPVFLSTAIPYVNGAPHLGHALELVHADAVARHRRRLGHDVRLQSGSDDNSLKSVRAAREHGLDVAELVRQNAQKFRDLAGLLDVELSDFVRTGSDPRHAPAVHRLWRACERAGDVYRRSYSGLYCVGCEQFYAERELEGGRCPEHAAELELVTEENYFFRASRYTAAVREAIADGRLRVRPESRRSEALAVLDEGLRDFSVSRSRARAHGWGIAVPGDDDQVVFVWFDALANYVSGLGYAANAADFARYWLESSARSHVIGKGVLRFHALYWPAILLSAGLPLPTELLVHGYVTSAGLKIGKSLGNAVDAREIVQRYGSDVVRYYVLRQLHTTSDSDFSTARLVQTRDAELADQLGNLLQRSSTLVERHCAGRVPAPGERGAAEQALEQAARSAWAEHRRAFDDYDLSGAGRAAIEFVAAANRYTDARAPWSLARRGEAGALATVLYELVEALRHAAWLLWPLIPSSAERIWSRLGDRAVSPLDRTGRLDWGLTRPGTRVEVGAPLFPKSPE